MLFRSRVDYIGYNSLYGDMIGAALAGDGIGEVRLHVAVRTKDREDAVCVSNEGDAIYTNGPTGGGGATMKVSEIINVFSYFIEKTDIQVKVNYEVI